VGIQRSKAEVGLISGPTWHVSHSRGRRYDINHRGCLSHYEVGEMLKGQGFKVILGDRIIMRSCLLLLCVLYPAWTWWLKLGLGR
jgi:hypothetical protein